jgi:hypothetical protein
MMNLASRLRDGRFSNRRVGDRPPIFPFTKSQVPDSYYREHSVLYQTRRPFFPRLHQRTSWGSGFTYSDDPSNAAWTKTNATGSANQVANPADGLSTAGKLLETSATGEHKMARAFTFTQESHAIQLFARYLGRDWLRILANDGTEDFEYWVNLATGATKPFADIINATTLNGGFETAGAPFDSWITGTAGGTSAVTRDMSDYYVGTASCRLSVDSSGNRAYAYQSVLSVGRLYRVGFWARHNGSGGSVLFGDGLQTRMVQAITSTWTYYEVSFIATGALVDFSSISANAVINLDGVTVVPLSAAPLIASGALNGGFETAGSPLGSWTAGTAGGTSAVTRDTSDYYVGTASCRLSVDSSGNQAYLYQSVLNVSRLYRVGFWARHNGSGGSIFFYDGLQTPFVQALTSAWTYYEFSFTAAGMLAYFASNSANAVINLDQVSVTPLDPPAVVATACPAPGESWWRLALVLPWVRAAAGTVTLALSTDGTTLSYTGDTAKGAYLWAINCRPGTATTLGPAISTLGTARTVLAPDLDPDDPFAYLLAESDPESAGGDLVRVTRTFARHPAPQVSYPPEGRPFARNAGHDIKSGSTYAASYDEGRTTHLHSTRKAVSDVGTVTATYLSNGNARGLLPHAQVTVELNNSAQSFYADDSDTTIKNACSIAYSGATTYASSFYVDRNMDGIAIYIRAGTGQPIATFQFKNVATASLDLTVSTSILARGVNIGQTALLARIDANERRIPATRVLTTSSTHSGNAGEWLAAWNGDRLVGIIKALAVPTTSTVTIAADEAPWNNSGLVITHLAFAGQAATRVVNSVKDCTIRHTDDFYLPGVTMLVDGSTLSTGADLPAVTLVNDPIGWVDTIVAGTTYAAIGTGRGEGGMGALVAKRTEAVEMADAVTTAGLAV